MTDHAELRRLAEHGLKTGHGVLLRDRELLDLLDEIDDLRQELIEAQGAFNEALARNRARLEQSHIANAQLGASLVEALAQLNEQAKPLCRCGHPEKAHSDDDVCMVTGALCFCHGYEPFIKRNNACGVCLECDPPVGGIARMYVCAMCGNKRCPAAIDCLKWDCSGSNATNQVPVPKSKSNEFEMNTGGILHNVHAETVCAGSYCLVHNPSDHHMRDWPMNWREDRGLMERICPHGVGHPDPDDIGEGTHGCDGCCQTE